MPRQPWIVEEDDMLRGAVESLGARNWKDVARRVPGRSHVQCLQRWNKVLRPGLKKGPWTKEEDDRLRSEVGVFKDEGRDIKWRYVARGLEGRSTKQCYNRWRNCLDPQVNRSEWTVEDDYMITTLYNQIGNHWASIAQSFPGRTNLQVKHRFRGIQRAKKRMWSAQEDAMLLEMVQSGSSFDEVSQVLIRRTSNAVKTRYGQLT